MKEIYVHTLRYHYQGRGNRASRIMFPISYGPFKDDESAWEWVRQSGITHSTKLMSVPAADNVRFPDNLLLGNTDQGHTSFSGVQAQQGAAL
jgi:hypothetical protein